AVVGLHLNSVPLRLQIGPASWTDLIAQVFEGERRVAEHRRYPLQLIQQHLLPEAPFDTLFNYIHFHVYAELDENAAVVVRGASAHEQTNYPLTTSFYVRPGTGEVQIVLTYHRAVLS